MRQAHESIATTLCGASLDQSRKNAEQKTLEDCVGKSSDEQISCRIYSVDRPGYPTCEYSDIMRAQAAVWLGHARLVHPL